MPTVERENIGLLTDKLTVKISKEDYMPSFEKKLKEYSKTANIPGFRKGMVPAGMIKKMYGAGIFSDEILKTVEKQLYSYLNEEKPDIFAQPLPIEADLAKLDLNNPGDYDFGFEIGLKPVFEMPDLSTAPLTLNNISITDEMVNDEFSRLQIKGGSSADQEVIDNPENELTLTFKETDAEGNSIEGGITEEISTLLKNFTPEVHQQLMGKKAGDHLVIQPDKAFDAEELKNILDDLKMDINDPQAGNKFFKIEIIKIGLLTKREPDAVFFDEIFPGVNITTEEEFREKIRADMHSYWNSQSRNQLHDQLYHLLIDQTKMEFPEPFLKRWLQSEGEKPKTAEEAEREFPTFSNQLKWTLISDRLIKENSLDVSNDELREFMKKEVMNYFGQLNMGNDMGWLDGYVDRMMKDEKHIDSTYRKVVTDKLFQWLESQVKPDEKSITAKEFLDLQHNHSH